uniref:Uncharacterized protein n=1 Tax=Onchocerca volvulus TaxID=6282 RepID=A0A2K6VF12_ONCVO
MQLARPAAFPGRFLFSGSCPNNNRKDDDIVSLIIDVINCSNSNSAASSYQTIHQQEDRFPEILTLVSSRISENFQNIDGTNRSTDDKLSASLHQRQRRK